MVTRKQERAKNAALVQRKTDAGLVKISKSVWVLKKDVNAARDAMGEAASEFVEKGEIRYKSHMSKQNK